MHSTMLFGLVSVAFCATYGSYAHNPCRFYLWCMGFQMTTLVGIVRNSLVLIQTGHKAFSCLLYLGALTLPFPDVWLVYTLCMVALLTRRFVKGCLFDLITNCGFTHSMWVDVLYFLPIPLSLRFGTCCAISDHSSANSFAVDAVPLYAPVLYQIF